MAERPLDTMIRERTNILYRDLELLRWMHGQLVEDPTRSTLYRDDKESVLEAYISFSEPINDSLKYRDEKGNDRSLGLKDFRNRLSKMDIMPSAYLNDIYKAFNRLETGKGYVYEFIRNNIDKLNECRDLYMKIYAIKKHIPVEAVKETTERLIDVIVQSDDRLKPDEFQKEAIKRRLERPVVCGKLILESLVQIPQIWTWEEMYNIYRSKKKDTYSKPSKAKYFTDYGAEPDVTAINNPYGFDLEGLKEDFVERSPWRSQRKVSHYATRHQLPQEFDNLRDIANDTFNRKQQRRVMKHYCAGRYTFQIDHMETGDFKYLIAINVNTRKAFFAIPDSVRRKGKQWYPPGKAKEWNIESRDAVKELKHIMEQTPINAIMMDKESSFEGIEFQRFLRENNIDYRYVHKYDVEGVIHTQDPSRSTHNTTALVDRLIKTLRQMNYNLRNPSEINPETLFYLIHEYNNSVHTTLSRILRRKVTPNEVDGDVNLETELVKRIRVMNFFVEESNDYTLKEGAKVRVFNDAHKMDKVKPKLLPGTWEVVDRDNGLYSVSQGKNTIKVPRWMLQT